jgi:hypothetical protein
MISNYAVLYQLLVLVWMINHVPAYVRLGRIPAYCSTVHPIDFA